MSEEVTEQSAQDLENPKFEQPKNPVLITGATSGIGRALARRLASKHVPLIVHGRDQTLGDSLVEELKPLADGSLLNFELADLASQGEIRKLAERLGEKYSALHGLVNNAGVVMGARIMTDDQTEVTVAVNHVAPFLLTELTAELLAADDGGRVVNVNSFMHKRGEANLDNLNAELWFSPWKTYSNTKLFSLLSTFAWARRLSERNITVNAYNPGVVRTKMLGGGAVRFLAPLFAKSANTAASTAEFLAVSPKVEGITGCYFAATGSQKQPAAITKDEQLQEKVFDATEALIKN